MGRGFVVGDVVVVLNFHGRADTEACVASLVTGAPAATVLVVDNGSHDGTVDSVRRQWPHVATIQNEVNLGFAGGMNTGLRWALDHGAETITVLNNDTLVPVGVMDRLIATARTGAAVSPESGGAYYADGSERVWFGGGTIDGATGLARHQSDAELAKLALRDGLRATTTLAGCCVTASADTWRRVGLFDERYFLNFEDSDWSLRAAAAGVPLVVDPTIHIHHRVSASFVGAYSYLGLYYYARNGLLFVRGRQRGTARQAAIFLRRHVVPGLGHHARTRDWTELARRSVIVSAALASYASSQFGRAPRWLERRAAAWSRQGQPE
ncbi:glycosyltransferase [Janibacter sp. G56]|uniref:glycosyltransferase n=1 Tax=Janibacter sp. G56 TaxID=3418717 RepID=UPI003D0773B8